MNYSRSPPGHESPILALVLHTYNSNLGPLQSGLGLPDAGRMADFVVPVVQGHSGMLHHDTVRMSE
jgi:hypothetical protein